MIRNIEYEQQNIDFDECYPNGCIKCKNYDLYDVILQLDC